MFEKINAVLTGVAPILLHNGQLADPLNKWTKALKEVTSKRKKTDVDHEEVARLEWFGSLYVGDDGGPCVTGEMIEAWVKDGAKKSKLGKQVSASVFCDADSFAIKYKGTRDPEKMWAQGKFRDVRGVKVGQARVMRCRPILRDWSVEIALAYNPELITRSQLTKALADAGAWGLGDYRPRFGRCTVEVL